MLPSCTTTITPTPITTTTPTCPTVETGTLPNCQPSTCPAGEIGTPPDCQVNPDRGSTLNPGQVLQPGWYLESGNANYKLIMQGDGNLVLYHGSQALWSTGTAGDNGATVSMQTDGNLVVYYRGIAKWNSNTAGFSGAFLQLQDDSNLVVYHMGHPVWDWGAGYLGDQLIGWTLKPGAYLLSGDHRYELIMQASDGNLVLYHGSQALWSTGGAGAGAYAVLQGDANFVVYGSDGTARWSSNTAGFPGANLVLQNDSNLVIYHAGHPVWDWGSGYLGNQLNGWALGPGAFLLSPNHRYELIMQASDGNLVLYHGSQALWSTGGAGAGAVAVMQGDGNFVVYNGGAAKWNSQTAGYSGARLVLQDDDNLVIYQGSTAIWDWGSGKLVGGGGGGGNLGAAIASLAESQDQYGAAKIGNTPASTEDGGCNPYSAYWHDTQGSCPNGTAYNAWCAEFAAWAWRQSGVGFTWGWATGEINALAASFYYWGQATGHWHSLSSGYAPQLGDVAVYGSLALSSSTNGHVGIYVGGSATSPTVVNGNWANRWPSPTNDVVFLQTGEWSSDGTSSGGLDGYVSP